MGRFTDPLDEAKKDKALKAMTLAEFERQLQEIRAKNGWRIELECAGVWLLTVYDKETDKQLGETGSTSLEALL